MARIYGSKISLNNEAVLRFFENRGSRAKTGDIRIINSVLYQDNNPELALARDKYEKDLIQPLLEVEDSARVLDMGCGIGRWADALSKNIDYYHGTDFSTSLIEIANLCFAEMDHVTFQVLPCQDVSMAALGMVEKFDIVISAGLLIYLNDASIKDYFSGLVNCLRPGARIYLREPLAIDQRLTLSDHFSSELNHEYHVIYRTADELSDFFEILTDNGLSKVTSDWVYKDEDLNNRTESRQRYWVFRS